MSIQDTLEKMKKIQSELLDFIEIDDNTEVLLNNLKIIFDDLKISQNKHEFSLFLHLLAKIPLHHNHSANFYQKIDLILRHFEKEIKANYENFEIYNFFKRNKRILYFLIKEKVLIVDNQIARKLTSLKGIKENYPQYFAPELKPFLKDNFFNKTVTEILNKELPNNFEKNREIGENDSHICELIRNDSIEEFVIYYNQHNLTNDSRIILSVFETNAFLLKLQRQLKTTIMDYAIFYGSIQIFNFMLSKSDKLSQFCWIYGILSNNAEILSCLEENDNTNSKSKEINLLAYKEAIKSFHNNVALYIKDNYLNDHKFDSREECIRALKYFNFEMIQSDLIDKSFFYDFCRYDYSLFVEFLLKNADVDINEVRILKNEVIFLYSFEFEYFHRITKTIFF